MPVLALEAPSYPSPLAASRCRVSGNHRLPQVGRIPGARRDDGHHPAAAFRGSTAEEDEAVAGPLLFRGGRGQSRRSGRRLR